MKILREYRAHMIYGQSGTQNSMAAFLSNFGLRKGQCQVKLGQSVKFSDSKNVL